LKECGNGIDSGIEKVNRGESNRVRIDKVRIGGDIEVVRIRLNANSGRVNVES